MSAIGDIIARLNLRPHPEGGMYAETWRDDTPDGGRGAGTAIYYLLRAGERSHWHRVDATEIWHFYAGDPLTLRLSEDGRSERKTVLGPDFAAGQSPQVIVAPQVWQAAEPAGRWTLVGCTVSPAFRFEGFEMAPTGWNPGD
ncbi:cupin [Paramagnetospirillum kuznetsovii]|uniref:Cupin n=1 Tax=Paramagnetospirillum kuznetsovii TaxID=2053833 RepID=A0A364P2G6_9PROT|nr:cupin domain-containing protein [Paramagnetospirillum kuznetsovii]RAU23347.1 cupin [Paramagnetospirillum kuznetsovii]